MTTQSSLAPEDGGKEQPKRNGELPLNGAHSSLPGASASQGLEPLGRERVRAVMKLFIRHMLDAEPTNGHVNTTHE